MHLFETDRLIARQLSQRDLPNLTEILSDPEVMEYSVRGVCDESDTRQFINWCLECYSSHGVGPWGIVEKGSGNFVGFCGVGPELVEDVEEISLGYRLARKFWNQGLATEAAKGVLGYAFSQTHISSVVVIVEPEHAASIGVSEKIGFRGYRNLDFHGRPVRLYRLARQDWDAVHKK